MNQSILGTEGSVIPFYPKFPPSTFILLVIFCILLVTGDAYGAKLPGSDNSDKLEAAGILIRLIDIGVFKWLSRILAGICIVSGGLALKEQRFPIFVMCLIAAVFIGTAPMWVKNIFDIGGGGTLFSMVSTPIPIVRLGIKMHSYEKLKSQAEPISQTIDEPIKFLDFWDLWDLGLATLVIFIFGIISYAWGMMMLGLIIVLFRHTTNQKKE